MTQPASDAITHPLYENAGHGNLAERPMRFSTRLEGIRNALAIDTKRMGAPELAAVYRLTSRLNDRICCELWAAENGWDIPQYGTPEWCEMQSAWLNSND